MDSHTMVLIGGGLLAVWLAFRFIRAIFRLVLTLFVILLVLWLFEPSRNWLKERLGLPVTHTPPATFG